ITNANLHFDGLGNAFGLTKDGPGTLLLTGTSTFSGGTNVAAGTLKLSGDTARLTATSSVTVQSGAIFDISGGTAAAAVDHIANTAALNLNGGTFRIVTPASTAAAQIEA